MYSSDSRMRRDINGYLNEMRDANLCEDYIRESRSILFRFQSHCASNGIAASGRITVEEVRTFLDGFQHMSSAYRRFVWAIVRKFLAETDNTKALKFRLRISGNSRARVSWLTPEETEQILATGMTAREALLIRAGLLQGLRRIEIVRTTVKDATSALLSGVLTVHGKGGKTRSIPLHPGYAQALEAYLRDCPREGNAPLLEIGRNRAGAVVIEFSLRFGSRFTSHCLRRSFGRNLWLKGVDVLTISELMGHSSVDQTRRYIGLDIGDMKKAIAQYGTRSELKIINAVPQRRIAPERGAETDEILRVP